MLAHLQYNHIMNKTTSIYRAIAHRIGHGSRESCWRISTNEASDSVSAVNSSVTDLYGSFIRTITTAHHPNAQESRAGGSAPEQQEMSFAERLAQGPGLDEFIMNNKYSVYAPNPKVCPACFDTRVLCLYIYNSSG